VRSLATRPSCSAILLLDGPAGSGGGSHHSTLNKITHIQSSSLCSELAVNEHLFTVACCSKTRYTKPSGFCTTWRRSPHQRVDQHVCGFNGTLQSSTTCFLLESGWHGVPTCDEKHDVSRHRRSLPGTEGGVTPST
jgi:hypothetical protein